MQVSEAAAPVALKAPSRLLSTHALLTPPLDRLCPHQIVESERASAKGHKLFTVTVLPDGPPAACLCWHHGVAEHIGRYKQGGWQGGGRGG